MGSSLPSIGWDGLAADALGEVFAALPDAASRAACRAVCRRWREVADASPAIWGACSLRRRSAPPSGTAAARAAATAASPHTSPVIPLHSAHALLARQRPCLRRLHLDLGAVQEGASGSPADALAAAVAAACGPGSGLTDLSLAICGMLPACVAQALPGAASQLSALSLRPLPGGMAVAVSWAHLSRLTQLACLVLTCDLSRAGDAAGLAQLTGLTRLRLHGTAARYRGQQPPEVGPALLACPTTLQRLELAAVELRRLYGQRGEQDQGQAVQPAVQGAMAGGLQGPAAGAAAWGHPQAVAGGLVPAQAQPAAAAAAGAQPVAAGLAAAQEEAAAQHAAAGGGQPDELDDGRSSATSDAASSSSEGASSASQSASESGGEEGASTGSEHELEEDGGEEEEDEEAAAPAHGGVDWHWDEPHSGSRRHCVELAARWVHLEALRLHGVSTTVSVLQVLPSLPCLISLHMAPQGCSQQTVRIAQHCSGLQELVLGRYADFHLPPLPPGALAQLSRLRISGSNKLESIHPSWCALPNLLSLELESCERLEQLPEELSALDRLERLSFSHQHMQELPRTLRGLSQLTRLAVAACSLEELAPGPHLRQLRELILFANHLSCVPRALVHPEWGPSSLRRLDLSSNYSHHLSADDVATLRLLPTLELLNMRRQVYTAGDEHPAEQLQELRATLPSCEILA